jgi:hypothetical protein
MSQHFKWSSRRRQRLLFGWIKRDLKRESNCEGRFSLVVIPWRIFSFHFLHSCKIWFWKRLWVSLGIWNSESWHCKVFLRGPKHKQLTTIHCKLRHPMEEDCQSRQHKDWNSVDDGSQHGSVHPTRSTFW